MDRAGGNVEYIPLIGDEEYRDSANETLDHHDDKERFDTSNDTPAQIRWSQRLSPLLILSALLVTLASFFINGAQTWMASRSSNLDVLSLRRPSLYIGLDNAPRIKSTVPAAKGETTVQGFNRPARIVSISAHDPMSSFTQDTDRWVLLTKSDRAFLEFDLFDVHESSSKICRVAVHFPLRKDLADKMLTLEGTLPKVDVGLLSTSTNISEANWVSQPAVIQDLGSVEGRFGEIKLFESFTCSYNTRISIMLSCSPDDCRVEYEDRTSQPLLGFYLIMS